jgi:hypothetical protein
VLERVRHGYCEATPGGGVHLLYRCAEVAGNTRLARTPEGLPLIETRGEGGFTVLAPSGGPVHRSGKPWVLLRGSLAEVVTLDPDERAALLDLCRAFDQAPSEHEGGHEHEGQGEPPERHERPLERPLSAAEGSGAVIDPTRWVDATEAAYNEATSWAGVLDGWTLHHEAGGIAYWTRPGKATRDGYSATTNATGADRLIVFSSSVPGFVPWSGNGPATSYNRFGATAVLRYGGDRLAAARALRSMGYGPPEPPKGAALLAELHDPTPSAPRPSEGHEGGTGGNELAPPSEPHAPEDWQPRDLASAHEGQPVPTILAPPGGAALVYAGRVNSLFGESGSGKTWATYAALGEVVAHGGRVIVIDLEDNAAGFVGRMGTMGLDRETMTKLVTYLAPESAWDGEMARWFLALAAELRPELVIIDSTGEALALQALRGNEDDAVSLWFRVFPRLIADRTGAAVLLVDHVPKSPDAPTGFAIGSQRKRAAVNGAAYRLDAIRAPSRDNEGLLKLVVAKDRHGTRATGTTAALVRMTPNATGGLTLGVENPSPDGIFRPTTLMERVSGYLMLNPGASKRAVCRDVPGKETALRAAVDALVTEGFLTVELGPRAAQLYTSVKPFTGNGSEELAALVAEDGG